LQRLDRSIAPGRYLLRLRGEQRCDQVGWTTRRGVVGT
jgi:hypothetical protein